MGDKQKLVVDTSCWMNNKINEDIIKRYNIIVPYIILQELDGLKESENQNTAYKSRRAIRFIDNNFNNLNFVQHDDGFSNNDDKIINTAKRFDSGVVTDDICFKVKARTLKIPIVELGNKKEKYKGYKEIIDNGKNSSTLANIYENKTNNILNLHINEYLLIKDKSGNTVDKMKYTSNGLVNFNNKNIGSKTIGDIKALDEYQSCLIDSLINNQMTMVKGKAGSGKTLISLTYAFSMIDKGKYDKLIIFCNPINSRYSAEIGLRPGTKDEKLLSSSVGNMLASKLGGIDGVYQLINSGKLLLLPFSDLRGFDSTGSKSIIYISESQNLTVDLLKLGIQRVGEDCKLIIDGDNNSQVDMSAYEGNNNGMKRVSEVFRGQDFYGEIELQNIYRSKLAKIADLM